MQPFGAGFGGFGGERLGGMRFEVLARLFFLLDALAHAFAGRDHEKRDVIASAFFRIENVIAQAESIGLGLAAEPERVQRRFRSRREKMDRISIALGLEKLPNAARLHPSREILFYFFGLVV